MGENGAGRKGGGEWEKEYRERRDDGRGQE